MSASNRSPKKRHSFSLLWLFLLFLSINMLCSPPGIPKEATVKAFPLEQIQGATLRSLLKKPIAITNAEVRASFYFFKWGFYFIRAGKSKRTMIVFTKTIPFMEGTPVEILGVVKPLLLNDSIDLVYVKEEIVRKM